MTYYTVYKITNNINNKIYIGMHKTSNLDDGYMGSGKLIRCAVKKYGIDAFTKEYLYVFDNSEDMFNMETIIVNEEFVNRDDTYNLVEGGDDIFYHLNYGNQKHLNLRFNKERQAQISGVKNFTPEQRLEYCKKGGHRRVELHGYPNADGAATRGRKLSDGHKKKIGKANSINQKGEKNSQYGKPRPSDVRDKIRQSLKSKPFIKCPYCEKESNNIGSMNRWHFENCKHKVKT